MAEAIGVCEFRPLVKRGGVDNLGVLGGISRDQRIEQNSSDQTGLSVRDGCSQRFRAVRRFSALQNSIRLDMLELCVD